VEIEIQLRGATPQRDTLEAIVIRPYGLKQHLMLVGPTPKQKIDVVGALSTVD
jgi:hypothetical protein